MLEWDEQKVLVNIKKSDTDDLMDRITAYRAGMEPVAVEMIENELQGRGVTPEQIAARRKSYEQTCLFDADGSAKMCSQCRKPAILEKWAWHRLMNKIPLLPRRLRYCADHAPPPKGT